MANDISLDFQTPLPVGRYMVSLIPAGVRTVLEPTPGIGNLVSCLEGYEVTAPEDYFLLDKNLRFDCIVMNPPFSYASGNIANAPPSYFKKKGMKMGYNILSECTYKADSIIALMPVFLLTDSDVRMRFYKRWGLISVTLLPRKTFAYARIQTCILELQSGYIGSTEFKVYDLLPQIMDKNELLLNL